MSRTSPSHASFVAHKENSKPAIPPSKASKTLSVSNSRMSRPRLAPKARRVAISFWRLAARASNMFARLTQATSRTSPTAAIRPAANALNQRSSVSPKYVARRRVIVIVSSDASVWGCASWRVRTPASAWACPRLIPGARRPSTWSWRFTGSWSQSLFGISCVCIARGAQNSGTCGGLPVPMNSGGATPTIVKVTPFISRVFPEICESELNWCCQKGWLRTMTGFVPGA